MLTVFCKVEPEKRKHDPIDYECMDMVGFWVVKKKPEPELDYVELEDMLDKEQEKTTERGSSNTPRH